jgi:DNA-binding transcriptional MerR regulator
MSVMNTRDSQKRPGDPGTGPFFSIGEFSKIVAFSVKTLRFYHEKDLLPPAWVDEDTGYRYYTHAQVTKAHVIHTLRAMEFTLEDIRDIVQHCDDDGQILAHLERQRTTIEGKIRQHRLVVTSLERLIQQERDAAMTAQHASFEVEEKELEPQLIGGVRMKGKYSDCGKGFAKLGKALGRYAKGKPFCLYYDGEYREDDADLEACFSLRKAKEAEGISVRELPGGSCVALLHHGPYEELGRSYEKIFEYINEKGYGTTLPSREIYLKGPGMIFRGNPEKYLTEIQILITR